jgi:hypothetical protein
MEIVSMSPYYIEAFGADGAHLATYQRVTQEYAVQYANRLVRRGVAARARVLTYGEDVDYGVIIHEVEKNR